MKLRTLLAILIVAGAAAVGVAAPPTGTDDDGFHRAYKKAASGTTAILYVGIPQPTILDNAATYSCSPIPGYADGVYICYRVKAGEEPKFSRIDATVPAPPVTITQPVIHYPLVVQQPSCPNGLCPNIIRSFR